MGVTIENWRAAIGTFKGGRSGILPNVKLDTKRSSAGCTIVGLVLIFLLMTPFLIQVWSSLLMIKCSGSSSIKSYEEQATKVHVHQVPCVSHDGLVAFPQLSRKKMNQLARAITGNRCNRSIKMAHWNAGSAHLHNKMDELESVIAEHHPHILGISEANFRKDHSLEEVQIENYDLVLSKTIENEYLGVSRVVCYKHHSVVGKVREDLMDGNMSSIWLELGLPKKKKFLVCQLYREWQYLGQRDSSSRSIPEQIARWSLLLDQWQRALASGKEVIVMGDFNLNYFKFDDAGQLQPLVDMLKEQVYPHGVHQCVHGPTHSWPGQADSCIDLVYTNTPEKIGSTQTFTRGSSDHRLILVNKKSKTIRYNTRYVKKRSYKNFNEFEFRAAVKNIHWYELYSCEDADLAVDIFTTKLTDILDKMAPIKTFQVRTKYAAWISDATKQKIKSRNTAQLTASTSQLQEDWKRYRRLRNDLEVEKRREKRTWQQQKLKTCEEMSDSRGLWKNILGWLNWSTTNSPTKLLQDGVLETSPSRMAEIQNQYYIDKVKLIRQNMPAQKKDPLTCLRQRMQGRAKPFSPSPVTPNQIEKIISNLKNSRASGVDFIDTYIIKLIKPDIVPAICHIVNLSIQTSRFPTKWKIAKIIPLYKGKGCKLDKKNYRPVAILPVVSKVLERAVFMQIVRHMDSNKYFNPSHHAYRSFHSTTTAMLQMYDTWLTAVESGDLAGVCMIDMSAAFDVVDTNLLLEKLKLYGFDKNAVQWSWSYLSYRSQGVYIDGHMSSLLGLEAGVPQGSILGPIYYTIFTNELPQVVHEADCPLHHDSEAGIFTINCQECGGLCCYADDSTYTVRGKDPVDLSEKLSKKYKVVADYLTDNKLKVNDDKTHLLVLTTRQKRRYVVTNSVRIETPTASIKPSRVEQLLGAQVHQDLRWVNHILDSDASLLKALNMRIGALRNVINIASFKTRKAIGNGIFLSKLIYLMPLWAGCEEYLINSLQVAQNKAARCISRLNIYTPTREILKVCGWMSVRQLMVYHSLVLLHKTLANQSPVYLYQKVTSGGEFSYCTRQATAGSVRQGPGPKKDLTRLGWCWRSVDLYNTLPTDLKVERKLPSFKKRLKDWIEINIII